MSDSNVPPVNNPTEWPELWIVASKQSESYYEVMVVQTEERAEQIAEDRRRVYRDVYIQKFQTV